MKCKTFIMILYCAENNSVFFFWSPYGFFYILMWVIRVKNLWWFFIMCMNIIRDKFTFHHVFTPYSANFHQLPYLYMWYWVLDVFIISWIFLLSYRKTMKVKTCRSIFEFINMMNITILCIRTIRGLYVDLDRLCGNG